MPKTKKKEMCPVSLQVTPELKKLIQARAEKNRQSVNAMITMVVEEYLEEDFEK